MHTKHCEVPLTAKFASFIMTAWLPVIVISDLILLSD